MKIRTPLLDSRVSLMAAVVALVAGTTWSLTVVEDFEFYTNGQLGANAGGSGFKHSRSTFFRVQS